MAGEPTQPQPAFGGRAVDDRLDSWKEIAAYLKKEVRTVQRWEKSSGLPVRRLTHGKLGTVFAYKSELDAWWQESQNEVDDGNNSEDELDDSNLAIAELVPTAEDLEKHTRIRTYRFRGIAVISVLAVFGLAVLLLFLWSPIKEWIRQPEGRMILAVTPSGT